MSRTVLEVLGPSTGGIRRHVAALADGLPALGWDATIAGPAGVMDGLTDGVVPIAVPAAMSTALRHPDRFSAAASSVGRLGRSHDVIHAHGLKAGLLAATIRGRPLVLTVHNIVLDVVAGSGAGLLRRVERGVVRRFDRVICGSAEIATHLGDTVSAERLRIITPAALDPMPRRSRAEVRSDLGIVQDDQLVVAVARLHPQKNLELLIRSFAVVAADHLRARLVLIGEGPSRGELTRMIDALGMSERVTLAGARPNPADEMAAADIVALSSTWEGVPIVAAEALQLGRPLVMTAVGSIGSAMALDGIGGTAVPVGDERSFTAALDHYLRDPGAAERAGVAGRALGEQYRAEHLVAAVAAVYEEVAG